MKLLKKLLVSLIAVIGLVALVGCSNVTQAYADKIDEAAANGEHYTVEQIRKDLGDECIELLILNNGVIVAAKGITSKEELEEKIDNDEDIKGIVITILGGKALDAEYKVIEAEDLK